MRCRWHAVCLIALPVLLLASVVARGAATKTWSASTADEFAAGTLDGTAVDDEGQIALSWSFANLWGPEPGIVWSLAPEPDGSGVLAAMSAPPRLVRVGPDGAAEVRYWLEGEGLLTSVVTGPDGTVWVGRAPQGDVIRLDDSGTVEPVLATGARFVWALAAGALGELWVGTGLPGSILRRSAGGETEVVHETGDDPVRCLAAAADGGVLAGTGGRGRVIRVAADGTVRVLLDAEEAEIVAIHAAPDGVVYALAASGTRQVAPSAARPVATGAVETVKVTAKAPSKPDNDEAGESPILTQAAAAPSSGFRTPPGAALYRIDPDGGWQRLWKSDSQVPFALARSAGGRLIVATGDIGRVHVLSADGRPAMLLEIPSDQVSAATTAADGALWVAGTTDARVLRLQPTPRASGRWLSAAIDAGAVADWGRVDWDADVPRGAKLRVHVRAGNTDEPDETWHEWVELDTRDGGAGGVTPSFRYFQTRFTLESSRGGESPSLRAVEVRYRAHNRPPEITQLTVEPSGVVYTRGPAATNRRGGPLVLEDPVSRLTIERLRPTATRGPVRRSFEHGARTVTWKAADPDQDRLRFRLEIRREESDHWSPLVAEVGDEFHSWDARGLRDGSYRLRLTADDAMDNPADASLRVQRISARFRVDHTRPSIGEPRFERRAEGVNIEFEATDRGGSVAAVEVALDGEGWTMVDPLDGVADSASERYRLTVEPGHETRTVDVRVVDAAGNLGGDSWSIDPAE